MLKKLACLLIVLSMSAFIGVSEGAWFNNNGPNKQSFSVNPGSTTDVIFNPMKAGSWLARAYHRNPFVVSEGSNNGTDGKDSCVIFVYWRNRFNPRYDSWNFFHSDPISFLWLSPFRCNLYSGDSSIQYLFSIVNYSGENPYTVTLNIQEN